MSKSKHELKPWLLRYTVQNGDYEYPDQTVVFAADYDLARKEAERLMDEEGELIHDSFIESAEAVFLQELSLEDLAVLTRLRLV